MAVSPTSPETQTFTRMQHPGRQRTARWVWLALAIPILLIYLLGFAQFWSVLQRGLPLLDVAVLEAAPDERLRVLNADERLQTAGISAGDLLLAINDDSSAITALIDRLNGGDSSGLSTFPADVGRVGDTIRLTVAGDDPIGRVVEWPLTQPNNLLMRSLTTLGFGLNTAAIFTYGIELLYALVFVGIAGVLYLYRADDWMALLAAAAILSLGLATGLASHPNSIVWSHPALRTTILVSGIVIYLAGLLFPEGRVVRWSLIFLAVYLLQLVLTFINSVFPGWLPPISATIIQISYVIALVGLIVTVRYRYQHMLTAAQRQQIKWTLLGMLALIIGLLIVTSYRVLFQLGMTGAALTYFAIAFPLETLLSLALPVSIVFAIMQYRLWDIDLVLNRSVVYGTVLVGMVLIFAMVFIVTQTLMAALLDPASNGVALAISALAVGLAFNPARSYVQHYVDRRLFGLRFDLNQLKAAQQPVDTPGGLTGRIIAGYKLADLIGRGGMGEVYKAYQGNQLVAIKTLRDDVQSDVQARQRFLREGEFQLEHPNIARIDTIGEEDGIHYIVMDFIEGDNLRHHLRERGTDDLLDLETTLGIARDVCAGLQTAHERGFIHRDIKPGNIILRPNGDGETFTAVLTDFGVAKMQNATEITGTGAIGTIDYMAPEQIQAARTVDCRADVYALGVVLYEMLTGVRPFTGTAAQVMFAHLQQPAPDPLKANPYLPLSVALATMRAMAKDPDDRYDSAAEFAADLLEK